MLSQLHPNAKLNLVAFLDFPVTLRMDQRHQKWRALKVLI